MIRAYSLALRTFAQKFSGNADSDKEITIRREKRKTGAAEKGRKMQKFGYRNPRYQVDFPVRLTILGSARMARCRNISADGMRLMGREGLAPQVRGEVSFDYEEMSFDLCVRVAHSGSAWSGLRFLYRSDDQRNAVLELIARLSARQSRSGVLATPLPTEIIISRRRPSS